ncbi:MAG: hypothetical protein WC916_01355 [Candidatus Woesearchaeota archaeon]
MRLREFLKPTILKIGVSIGIFLILFLLMPAIEARYAEECWVKDTTYNYDVYKWDKHSPGCSIVEYNYSFLYGWNLLFPEPPMQTTRAIMIWETSHLILWSVSAMIVINMIVSYICSCTIIETIKRVKK